MKEGDPGGDLFIVLQGQVVVEAGGMGITTLAPGGQFGEMGLVDAAPRSARPDLDPVPGTWNRRRQAELHRRHYHDGGRLSV